MIQKRGRVRKFVLIFLAAIFALSFFGTSFGTKKVSAVTIQGINFEHIYFARVNTGDDSLVTHYYTENGSSKTMTFDAEKEEIKFSYQGLPNQNCTTIFSNLECGFGVYAIGGYRSDTFVGLFRNQIFYGVYSIQDQPAISSGKYIFVENTGSQDPYIIFLNSITSGTSIIDKPTVSPTQTPFATCLDPLLCPVEEGSAEGGTEPLIEQGPSTPGIASDIDINKITNTSIKSKAIEINQVLSCFAEVSSAEELTPTGGTVYVPSPGSGCDTLPSWVDVNKSVNDVMADVKTQISQLNTEASDSQIGLTTEEKSALSKITTGWDIQISAIEARPTSARSNPSLAGTTTKSNDLYDGKVCQGGADKEDVAISKLIEPFPGAMICRVEHGILGIIEWGFDTIQTSFSNILLVNSKLEGGKIVKGEALSKNDVVQTVSKLFIDFINSLFLLVALISILVTTLKIDIPVLNLGSWQLKKMIPTIIATMILVNYSLSIANLIIEIMDYLVSIFLLNPNMGDTSRFFKFDDKMYLVEGSSIGALVIRIIFLLAFLIITFYLMLVLWIRKIVLIVLYMFAPVPYLANIIPVDAVKQITNKWWGPFMNWGLMGPMVAVLLLAAGLAIGATTGVDVTDVNVEEVLKGSKEILKGGGLSLTNMILVGVLLYMAATMPLKLGGAIMASVQGYVGGKKGGAISPAVQARKYAETKGKTAAAGVKAKWAGAAAAGLEKGKGATFGQKLAAGISGRVQAPERALKKAQAGEEKSKREYEKALASTGKYITAKDIEDDAEKLKDNSVESLKDTTLTNKSAQKRAVALKALQMNMKNKAGTKEGKDAADAFNDVVARNNLGLNADSTIDASTIRAMAAISPIKTGIAGASGVADLENRLALASVNDIQNFDPTALDQSGRQQISDLLKSGGLLDDTAVNRSKTSFMGSASMVSAGLSSDADVIAAMDSGDRKTIDDVLKTKLGAGFATVQGSAEYMDMFKKTVARANLEKVSGKISNQNRIGSANFIKEMIDNEAAAGRDPNAMAGRLDASLAAIKTAGGTAKFDLLKRHFGPSWVGRISATDEEMNAYIGHMERSLNEARGGVAGGSVDAVKIGEYINKINPPKVT